MKKKKLLEASKSPEEAPRAELKHRKMRLVLIERRKLQVILAFVL
jgi:hypothetical protein